MYVRPSELSTEAMAQLLHALGGLMKNSPPEAGSRGSEDSTSSHAAALWTRPVSLLVLALAAWGARAVLAGPSFTWLLWNLFLALCPWLVSSWLVARPRSALGFAVGFAGWLVLLPNAPYLLTDLVHLRERPPVPLALDMLVFAAFALAGVGLGLGSLLSMEAEVRRRFGPRVALAMVLAVLPLCGWGVFLGRFQRWNSWDVLVRPLALLDDSLAALLHGRSIAFSAGFAALLAALYLAVRPTSHERAGRVK